MGNLQEVYAFEVSVRSSSGKRENNEKGDDIQSYIENDNARIKEGMTWRTRVFRKRVTVEWYYRYCTHEGGAPCRPLELIERRFR